MSFSIHFIPHTRFRKHKSRELSANACRLLVLAGLAIFWILFGGTILALT